MLVVCIRVDAARFPLVVDHSQRIAAPKDVAAQVDKHVDVKDQGGVATFRTRCSRPTDCLQGLRGTPPNSTSLE